MKNLLTTLILCTALTRTSSPILAATLPLIPYPQSVQLSDGSLPLTPTTRIVATDPSLTPLADLLSQEITRAGGPHLQTATDTPRPGDIVLALDTSLIGEAYHLIVQDRATVSAANYAALAMGTATLLQAMTVDTASASLPHMTVTDQPANSYRGLMIDVARKHHSVESLQAIVELCRLYKIRYLHLHLTDNEAFTFPSTAFPALTSKNYSGPAYTLDELKSLVKFADDRGVTIVPELEAPGHCAAMQRTMPDTFGMTGPDGKQVKINCLNFMNPKAYPALDTLVGEMCDVFKSSPFIHIGSDEAWLGEIGPRPETAQYLQQNGLDGAHELYTQYIVKMNDIVKKHGKKTIVWEGFGGDGSIHFKIPRDVTVMEFEVRYNLPRNLIKNGYPIINAAWTPLYVVNGTEQTPEHIFDWNLDRFGQYPHGGWDKVHWSQVDPTPQITGAQMCSWEQPDWLEIPSLRSRLPAMAQRIWNPSAAGDYADFATRFAATDALLDKLVYGFTLNVAQGPTPKSEDQYIYSKSAAISAAPLSPGLTIHYIINAADDPTADSPVLVAPLQITEKNGVDQDQSNAPKSLRTTLRVRAFDGQTPAGAPRVLILDNYDYLDRLPPAVHLKIFDNPTGDITRPDFANLKLLREINQPHVWPNALQDLPDHCVLVYEGKISVPADAKYQCVLRTEGGGAQLYINDQLVCDRSGKSGWDETKGSIDLSKDPVPFKVECYLSGKKMFFSLTLSDPAQKKPLGWNKLLIPLQKQ